MNDARGNDPSIMQDAVRVGLLSKGIDENTNLVNHACKQLEAVLSPRQFNLRITGCHESLHLSVHVVTVHVASHS